MKPIATSHSIAQIFIARRGCKAYFNSGGIAFSRALKYITLTDYGPKASLLIEPLERVILGVDGSVFEPAILLVRRFLGMEAVECSFFILSLVT